jgi:hypothetical protein
LNVVQVSVDDIVVMVQTILVLGGGQLGMAVLEALAQHSRRGDARVAVLLRPSTLDSTVPEKQHMVQHIKALGASLKAADVAVATVSELATVFAAHDIVVSCNGMTLPSGTQSKIAEAALEAGVKRFFPWQFGMDYDVIGQGSSQDLFDEQLAVRTLLRSQNETKWTIVSTGVFMSFLLESAFGVVDVGSRTVRALGTWDTRITATTPEDIGRVTADLILDPRETGQHSGVVYTAGDTISYGQLADRIDARFGPPPFKRELWDAAVLRSQMEDDANTMVKYRDTFSRGKGVAWEKEKTVNHQRAIPMTDVQAYLESLPTEERGV